MVYGGSSLSGSLVGSVVALVVGPCLPRSEGALFPTRLVRILVRPFCHMALVTVVLRLRRLLLPL